MIQVVRSTVAFKVLFDDAAQWAERILGSASGDPYATFPIEKYLVDMPARLEIDELVTRPVDETAGRADPEPTALGRSQCIDTRVAKVNSTRRGPRNEANAIKPYERILRPDPNVAVLCLCNCVRHSVQVAVLNTPRGVSVLGDAPLPVEGA
jgi:hypothetical protein